MLHGANFKRCSKSWYECTCAYHHPYGEKACSSTGVFTATPTRRTTEQMAGGVSGNFQINIFQTQTGEGGKTWGKVSWQ